jgi:hypothetical protein
MAHGCEQAGYRLAGAPLDHVCCRHLYGSDRLLTAWPAPVHAVILAVGPHDRSPLDVYRLLLAALAVEVLAEERSKPPCCDELEQPPADAHVAEALATAVTALGTGRRRRR